MKATQYHVLGVMSGTSLDGIDLASCFFHFHEGSIQYKIEITETIPYPENWEVMLKEAVHYSEGRLQQLNIAYTSFLAQTIGSFIARHHLNDLDAVCSHGHTVLHVPERGITLQIGNLPELAKKIGKKVVCDFRIQDVRLGGQGAPLVPIGDKLLFSKYEYCLNLGGFANISFEDKSKRIAYDICPVNIVLNTISEQLGAPYDAFGNWAKEGTLNEPLLDRLNAINYYELTPPKSLGLEWVKANIIPKIQEGVLSKKTLLRTFVEHIAIQISKQCNDNATILVTGGGAYNKFLLERLQFHYKGTLLIPETTLIEYKEALIFGLLGVLKLRDEVNCLATVTGASKDHSSGQVFLPHR